MALGRLPQLAHIEGRGAPTVYMPANARAILQETACFLQDEHAGEAYR
jgi:hypothetical protein